jgi:hypothetical protein
MPTRAPQAGFFWALAAALLVALTFVFEHIYGELVSQLVLTYVANRFGVTGEHLVASFAPHVLFGSLAALLLFVAFRLAYWHLSQTVLAENPSAPALTLSSMTVTEIAEYLRDQSIWAWRTYARLNDKIFVQDHVSVEMRRAGINGEVRFIGTLPNTAREVEIDPSYWRHIGIDDRRIWDSRNHRFTWFPTSAPSVPGLMHYDYGKAPRIHVMRTWPRASVARKLWALTWVAIKKRWWWIRAKFIG